MARKPVDPRVLLEMSIPESQVQSQIIGALHLYRYDVIYHTRFSVLSNRGMPDVLAARMEDRRIVLIECKREGQQPTENQSWYLEVFRLTRKVETYLVCPSNLEQVIQALR